MEENIKEKLIEEFNEIMKKQNKLDFNISSEIKRYSILEAYKIGLRFAIDLFERGIDDE